MVVWYVLIVVLFLVASIEVSTATKNILWDQTIGFYNQNQIMNRKQLIFIIIATVITLLAAFRFESGRDWGNYLDIFNNAEKYLQTGEIERGYLWINIVFRNIGLSYWIVQCCIILLCGISLHMYIYKKSPFMLYTLALYFYLFYFSLDLAQTRQYMAIAILLWGTKFIKKRKVILWILTVVIAMQFHITALMALPLYFTEKIKIKPWMAGCIFIFCVMVNLFGLSVIWKLMYFTTKMSFLPERILYRLNVYMNHAQYNKQLPITMGLIADYCFYAIVVFLYVLNYKNKKIDDSYILNFLISVFFFSMGRNFSQFSRLSDYYMLCGGGIFAYNIFPSSVYFLKKKYEITGIIGSILFLVFLIASLLRSYLSGTEYIYQSFLLQ